jgi:hypothetical protein
MTRTMTSRERVRAALNHSQPDYTPCDYFATPEIHRALTPGKMQHGSGWWFLDQKDGMERQLNALSNLGLLSRFVGMVTDSRSFLSYTIHIFASFCTSATRWRPRWGPATSPHWNDMPK